MRLWGDLVLLTFLVVCVAGLVVILYLDVAPNKAKPKKPQPSRWVACDYTRGNETVVIVELRQPKTKDSEEFDSIGQREVKRIVNVAVDYDQQYYNAMQDANARASLLNALHN